MSRDKTARQVLVDRFCEAVGHWRGDDIVDALDVYLKEREERASAPSVQNGAALREPSE